MKKWQKSTHTHTPINSIRLILTALVFALQVFPGLAKDETNCFIFHEALLMRCKESPIYKTQICCLPKDRAWMKTDICMKTEPYSGYKYYFGATTTTPEITDAICTEKGWKDKEKQETPPKTPENSNKCPDQINSWIGDERVCKENKNGTQKDCCIPPYKDSDFYDFNKESCKYGKWTIDLYKSPMTLRGNSGCKCKSDGGWDCSEVKPQPAPNPKEPQKIEKEPVSKNPETPKKTTPPVQDPNDPNCGCKPGEGDGGNGGGDKKEGGDKKCGTCPVKPGQPQPNQPPVAVKPPKEGLEKPAPKPALDCKKGERYDEIFVPNSPGSEPRCKENETLSNQKQIPYTNSDVLDSSRYAICCAKKKQESQYPQCDEKRSNFLLTEDRWYNEKYCQKNPKNEKERLCCIWWDYSYEPCLYRPDQQIFRFFDGKKLKTKDLPGWECGKDGWFQPGSGERSCRERLKLTSSDLENFCKEKKCCVPVSKWNIKDVESCPDSDGYVYYKGLTPIDGITKFECDEEGWVEKIEYEL